MDPSPQVVANGRHRGFMPHVRKVHRFKNLLGAGNCLGQLRHPSLLRNQLVEHGYEFGTKFSWIVPEPAQAEVSHHREWWSEIYYVLSVLYMNQWAKQWDKIKYNQLTRYSYTGSPLFTRPRINPRMKIHAGISMYFLLGTPWSKFCSE